MPILSKYIDDLDYDVDVDIDVDEFLYACSPSDTQEVIEQLIDNGDLDLKDTVDHSKMSASEKIFEEHLLSISGRWNQLTQEEEELILKIGARFRYL